MAPSETGGFQDDFFDPGFAFDPEPVIFDTAEIPVGFADENPAPSPVHLAVKRKPHKRVRILLDATVELSEQELSQARDSYLQEQMRLRKEFERDRVIKGAAERVHALFFAPPDISTYSMCQKRVILNTP